MTETRRLLLSIDHSTTYSYDRKVFLDPHTVRLRPRDDGSQMTHMFSLSTDPPEAGRSVNCDLDGNVTVTLWFLGEYDRLRIDTHCVVETLRENPFDFIVSDARFAELPMRYTEEQNIALAPYLAVSAETARAVSGIRETILSGTLGKTTDFVLSLCEHIHENFSHVARDEGAPWPAGKTLREKRGSCRDFVELFAAVCRSAGLACRHVSGYALNEKSEKEEDLHAWAEVYIPGGGWRGYDPSSGLAVADRHVAVASGAVHGLTAPVHGLIGTSGRDGAKSELRFRVRVRETGKDEKKGLGLL